ncbi:MAG: hypothetical protein QOE55_6874 [Acidobacteriaceae bacterium]|nr:hypothetical protein [Acidobacteriaceae bacterium]MEA3005406.1 hypothetical protein [Acidobacteriaceae bacterium]
MRAAEANHGRGLSYFAAFFAFAQRALCAAAIRARPAADIVRFLRTDAAVAGGLPELRFVAVPVSRLLACCR